MFAWSEKYHFGSFYTQLSCPFHQHRGLPHARPKGDRCRELIAQTLYFDWLGDRALTQTF